MTGSLLAAFVMIDWFHGVGRSMTAIAVSLIAIAVATVAGHGDPSSSPARRRKRAAGAIAALVAAAAGLAWLTYVPVAGALPWRRSHARDRAVARSPRSD